MSFNDAAAYDAFMGRYSGPLAPRFADLGRLSSGQAALDVGCGTGMLTRELVRRLGATAVVASDPSAPFVASVQARYPDVEVVQAPAEQLPFDGARFDAALAQLVVHFMTDPVAGLTEMRRVTKPRGVVAACVWDHVVDVVRSPCSGVARIRWMQMRPTSRRSREHERVISPSS